MLNSILNEPSYIENIYKEYLGLVKYHLHRMKRNSVFIRYYNINTDISMYNDTLSSIYDLYNISDIYFDIYEYTPAFTNQPIINRTGEMPDQQGIQWTGMSNITIYSIDTPKINDLITFYKPLDSYDIFRVVNLSAALNSYKTIPMFELELEYAPIKSLTNLKISNRYVYNIEKNINQNYDIYIKNITKLNKLAVILKYIYINYYCKNLDIYLLENRYIPCILNELIINIKKDNPNLLEQIKTPYYYNKYITEITDHTNFNIISTQVFDLEINSIINMDLSNYSKIQELYEVYYDINK